MAKLIEEGHPIYESIHKLEKEHAKTKHPLAPLLKELRSRLRGHTKSNQQVDVPNYGTRNIGTELVGLIPELEATLIQAGVNSSNGASGFKNAADLVASQSKMKNAVYSALAKPILYLAALCGLMIYISLNLLPSIEKYKPRSKWPDTALKLGWLADHTILIVGVIGALIFLTIIVFQFVMPRWTGAFREKLDRSILRIPAAMFGAQFLKTLSSYVSSGAPFDESIKGMANSGSAYMKYQCNKIMGLYRSGIRPEETLTKLSIIPKKFHWIIAIYGLSGDPSAAYKNIANEMGDSVQTLVNRSFGLILGNVMLLFIAVAVIWVYATIISIADPSSGLVK